MGTYWEGFIARLSNELQKCGTEHITHSVAAAYKGTEALEKMVGPYLGGDDPLFGKIFPGKLNDFFDNEKLGQIHFSRLGRPGDLY